MGVLFDRKECIMEVLILSWLNRTTRDTTGIYRLIGFASGLMSTEKESTDYSTNNDFSHSFVVEQTDKVPYDIMSWGHLHNSWFNKEIHNDSVLGVQTAYKTILKVIVDYIKMNPNGYILGYGFDDFFPKFIESVKVLFDKDTQGFFEKHENMFIDVKELSKCIYDDDDMGSYSINSAYLKVLECFEGDTPTDRLHQIDKLEYEMFNGFCVQGLTKLSAILHTIIYNRFNNDMDYLVDFYVKPHKLKRINFGKYNGQTYEEIAQNDPNYLSFLLNSSGQNGFKPLDKNIIYSIKRALFDAEC